jgi:hypothetical protein
MSQRGSCTPSAKNYGVLGRGEIVEMARLRIFLLVGKQANVSR